MPYGTKELKTNKGIRTNGKLSKCGCGRRSSGTWGNDTPSSTTHSGGGGGGVKSSLHVLIVTLIARHPHTAAGAAAPPAAPPMAGGGDSVQSDLLRVVVVRVVGIGAYIGEGRAGGALVMTDTVLDGRRKDRGGWTQGGGDGGGQRHVTVHRTRLQTVRKPCQALLGKTWGSASRLDTTWESPGFVWTWASVGMVAEAWGIRGWTEKGGGSSFDGYDRPDQGFPDT
ncbi:hypothetical protein GGX14DRAFT_406706 [Mycena pura]|uniref:Uncharacterized protein n=1 Tax=Mycena pura TaxID=153505 RepID=A0AAD6USQ5_9AGAR|nr:hypothetical protein GGX14DRAFT_406706 [Mycena pura]